MEWVIAGVLILFLLGCGCLTASGAILYSETMKRPIGKLSVRIGAVFLPVLLLSVIWIYNGIAVCSHCKSVTVNSYTPDNWIVDVNICRKCVEYIDVCDYCVKYVDSETAKLYKKPDKNSLTQRVCRNCDGSINMRDDEIGELFVQAALVVWLLGHWGTMIVAGIVWLVKKCKRKVEVDL